MDDRELPLSFHTEAFESSETEKENYCLLRAEILLSISDPGVRYLLHSSHFSLARAGSALHTCVFVTRSVLSDSACQPARLCNLIHSFVLHTPRLGIIAASQRTQAVAPERRRGMAMRRRHRQIHRQARVEGAPARGGACEGRIILYNSRGNSIDGTLHITRLRGPLWHGRA